MVSHVVVPPRGTLDELLITFFTPCIDLGFFGFFGVSGHRYEVFLDFPCIDMSFFVGFPDRGYRFYGFSVFYGY